jgi:hypothetical protein
LTILGSSINTGSPEFSETAATRALVDDLCATVGTTRQGGGERAQPEE